MLINLSNHPSEYWSKVQLIEAEKQFGNVIDILFPQIKPYASEKEIENLSNKYLGICLKKLSKVKDNNNAVHIMGELTFTYAIVNKLRKHNIVCVASTTERNAVEENGKKITEFNFVRFRKYL